MDLRGMEMKQNVRLLAAVKQGEVEELRTLRANKSDVIDFRASDAAGRTALMLAIEGGNEQIIRELLETEFRSSAKTDASVYVESGDNVELVKPPLDIDKSMQAERNGNQRAGRWRANGSDDGGRGLPSWRRTSAAEARSRCERLRYGR